MADAGRIGGGRADRRIGRVGRAGGVALAALAAAVILAAPGAASAQGSDDWCRQGRGSDHARFCEVRESTISAPAEGLEVDARPNGAIDVTAAGSGQVKVRARVTAHADSEDRARALAGDVRIETGGGHIRASGPDTGHGEWWSVSYRIEAPAATNIDLRATNGGIDVRGMRGTTTFRTLNGGARLEGLGGDVSGSTTNGGLHIVLSGARWQGRGMDVRTTNGGVDLAVPEGYAAHLETSTVNGGLDLGFPVTVQGRVGRQLSMDLGGGGPTIRAVTTNGGVSLHRP